MRKKWIYFRVGRFWKMDSNLHDELLELFQFFYDLYFFRNRIPNWNKSKSKLWKSFWIGSIKPMAKRTQIVTYTTGLTWDSSSPVAAQKELILLHSSIVTEAYKFNRTNDVLISHTMTMNWYEYPVSWI